MATDQLSAVFAALADPTRRAILARLADGEATVNELAEPFDVSLQAISKHLKVLERAGLISRGRQDIVIIRVFDAPKDVVFKAVTDPELVPKWWGPRQYETVVDRMDVRPGG